MIARASEVSLLKKAASMVLRAMTSEQSPSRVHMQFLGRQQSQWMIEAQKKLPSEEASFAGSNMQLWSKHMLLDADAAGSLEKA